MTEQDFQCCRLKAFDGFLIHAAIQRLTIRRGFVKPQDRENKGIRLEFAVVVCDAT